jgi:hypothetical protein
MECFGLTDLFTYIDTLSLDKFLIQSGLYSSEIRSVYMPRLIKGPVYVRILTFRFRNLIV